MKGVPKVPRWGIRNGIKYNPRRSILKLCPECKQLFVQYNKGYRVYCGDVCSSNAKRKQMQAVNAKILENRKKEEKFERALKERMAYAEKQRTRRTWKPGTDTVPKIPKKEMKDPDWEEYHQTLSAKLQRMKIK